MLCVNIVHRQLNVICSISTSSVECELISVSVRIVMLISPDTLEFEEEKKAQKTAVQLCATAHSHVCYFKVDNVYKTYCCYPRSKFVLKEKRNTLALTSRSLHGESVHTHMIGHEHTQNITKNIINILYRTFCYSKYK